MQQHQHQHQQQQQQVTTMPESPGAAGTKGAGNCVCGPF